MQALRSSIATAIVTLALSTTSTAQTLTYKVCLDGGQVQPPVNTIGSGEATITLDTTTGALSLTGTFSDLMSGVVFAHIHGNARIGGNAPVLWTLTTTGARDGTLSLNLNIGPGRINALMSGLLYIQVHTALNTAGEIRGQIVQLVDSTLPAERPADPTLSDSGGTLGIGPKIGSSSEGFNLSLDCTGAVDPGLFIIQLYSDVMPVPALNRFGFLYVTGLRLLSLTGTHTRSVERWSPTDITVPDSIALAGLPYHAQGFCAGYSPGGRMSNSLFQTIGI